MRVIAAGDFATTATDNLVTQNQLADGSAQTFWTANAIDAEQHITQQTAGNGVVTSRSFSALNGRLLSLAAGSGNSVQNSAYTYDLQ